MTASPERLAAQGVSSFTPRDAQTPVAGHGCRKGQRLLESRENPSSIAGARRQNGSLRPVGGPQHAALRGSRSTGAGSASAVGAVPTFPPSLARR